MIGAQVCDIGVVQSFARENSAVPQAGGILLSGFGETCVSKILASGPESVLLSFCSRLLQADAQALCIQFLRVCTYLPSERHRRGSSVVTAAASLSFSLSVVWQGHCATACS